ncbi:MAG: hypothetical protein PF444_10160 [Bacteroidales bacterium]|jgi:tRNA pseudouridine32 synthase/23S rRNA pseudouridine746 synthase|nr:hypothetical protein [Bacteroidales bacterium]
MHKPLIFNFKTDISKIDIPSTLNNPFATSIPQIARVATKEFQEYIIVESHKWKHDFHSQKGKMFGILVVQKEDQTYGFLGTFSGKFPEDISYHKFVPSVFDDSTDDFFINKGMTELSAIGNQIKNTTNPSEITLLKEERKQKSMALQQRLFENYRFHNLSGKEKSLLQIFAFSSHGHPPVAAGECAAPKLLQYAIEHHLRPIAVAEFWWGKSIKNNEKEHLFYYPACKDRCRPILEYMLEDTELFNRRSQLIK